ncbi:MAG: cytochrome b N-terminal domain-containing protein [Candidatus Latescibacterota bacterium]|nr:MAG: cytochrome b N-terminal domain-containing protein [Candidatus Latescibacterota bacterium]
MSDLKKTESQSGLLRRFWHSVFRGPVYPRDDSDRKLIVLSHLLLHFRPVRLPAKNLRYTHTWGLGGMSMTLFFVLAATGVLLMFVYEPSPGYAYDSIANLQTNLLFGKLIRNIHYWSANLLIVLVTFHLIRVYLTGAYYPPRQFNWVLGLLLLFCVLVSNFTGYLMPWDQLSYWAITIVTGMMGYAPFIGEWLQDVVRGGTEIGSTTLVNFYATHTTVMPALIIVLMMFHFWRIRKAGGVVIPRSPGEEKEEKPEQALTLPHLLLREFSVALVLIAFVMVLSVVFDAPLGEAANPGMSPNPAKAPWYFLGFQELLIHFDPLFAVVIIPLLGALGLFFIPYIRYEKDTSGIFMMSREGRRLGLVAALTALFITPVFIVADEYWIDWDAWMRGVSPVVSNGVLPATILGAALTGYCAFLKRRYSASNNEVVQFVFVLLSVAFVILTITEIWFRGPRMALVWPWSL